MRGVTKEGVDARLICIVLPWLAVLVLLGALIGTDIGWQRWFFGVQALVLGSVTTWFTVVTWKALR